MHNRKPDGVESREISLREALVVVPLVACIVALALYPGLILRPVRRRSGRPLTPETPAVAVAMSLHRPRHRLRRALAVIALTAGLVRRPARRAASAARPLDAVVSLHARRPSATAAGLCIWQWGERQGPGRGRAAPRRPRRSRIADRDRSPPRRSSSRSRCASRRPSASDGRPRRVPGAAARLGPRHGAARPWRRT